MSNRSTENKGRTLSPKQRLIGVVAITAAVSTCYLLFVAHYAINAPYEDDWTVVPLIHAALHGQLSFDALWTRHDENRMLIPNVVYVASGVLTHDDLRALVALSALALIGSFVLYLGLFRVYLGRSLPLLGVLVAALLWFSLEGWNNAIWGFQLAWYLVLFFLMCMIALLVTGRPRQLAFPLAVLAAVFASFSFINGLALWPVGLLCVIGGNSGRPSQWSRAQWTRVAVWTAAAIGTTTAVLWGYKPVPLGCNVSGRFQFVCSDSVSSHWLHHPGRVAEFVLVELGQALPNTDPSTIWRNAILGAALLALVAWVVLQSFRHGWDPRSRVPLALIAFGLLTDVLIAGARVDFLDSAAPSSTYTIPNILVLLAVIMHFWSHPPARLSSHRAWAWTACVGVAALLLLQVVLSVNIAIQGAREFDRRLVTGAQLVVNLDRIPAAQRGCYEVFGEFYYLLFIPNVSKYPAFGEARTDRLNVFSPPLYNAYRAEGLPLLPQCAKR